MDLSQLVLKHLYAQADRLAQAVTTTVQKPGIDRAAKAKKLEQQLATLEANLATVSLNSGLVPAEVAALEMHLQQVGQATRKALAPPDYKVTASLQEGIAYLEDHQTPLRLTIAAENPLAQRQKYQLVRWQMLQGAGQLLDGQGTPVKPDHPLSYGINQLVYVPQAGGRRFESRPDRFFKVLH